MARGNRTPLLVTLEQARRLGSQLRRRFSGGAGIRVQQTDDAVRIELARAGGGTGVSDEAPATGQVMRITSFANGNKQFNARALDDNGAVTGPVTLVYVYSLPKVAGFSGQQDLTLCYPNYIVGDEIWVELRRMYINGVMDSIYVATEAFFRKCP